MEVFIYDIQKKEIARCDIAPQGEPQSFSRGRSGNERCVLFPL
jgi:hypothetical protein